MKIRNLLALALITVFPIFATNFSALAQPNDTKDNRDSKKCVTWDYFVSNYSKFQKADLIVPYFDFPRQIPREYSKGCVFVLDTGGAAMILGVLKNQQRIRINSTEPYHIPYLRDNQKPNVSDSLIPNSALTIIRYCLTGFCIRQHPPDRAYPHLIDDFNGQSAACFRFTCLQDSDIPAKDLLNYWKSRL